jgi:hypothetical protein
MPDELSEIARALVQLRSQNGEINPTELVEPLPVAILVHAGTIRGNVDWKRGSTPAELSEVLYRFIRQPTAEADLPLYAEDPHFREVTGGFLCTNCSEPHDVLCLVPGKSGDLTGAHRWCEECYAKRRGRG